MAARLRAWLRSGSAGGALVEMALVMPIMFLILTSIFTFSIATNHKLTLTEADTIGGNLLAVQRGQPNPCANVQAAVAAAAPSLAASSISMTFVMNGVTTTGTAASGGVTCPGASGAANPTLITGDPASLTLTYPCSLIVYGKNMLPSCTLTSQITEIVQ